MNRFLSLLLLLAISPMFLFAQVDETKPVSVTKAVAYAKSAPLSEIAAKLSPDKSDAMTPREVKNELDYNKWPNTDFTRATENVQSEMGQKQSRGPLAGFSGQGGTGYYPPDTDGDVSETHFVQVVNSKYNVYLKDGTKVLGPLNLSTLWASLPGPWVGSNDGDPIVLYDEEAQRWIITQFYVSNPSNNYELFAVSETSDPLGAYHLYAFGFGNQMNDYPKIGVWNDGYYATYNMFSGGFIGSKITVVEREKMLVGDPNASMIQFLKNNYYSTMPADIDGEILADEGEPCPVMYITDAKTLQIWSLHADWTTPSNSSLNLTKTLVPSYFSEYNGSIPQPNGNGLDALGGMIMNRLAYRRFETHESMVVNHTVVANGKAGIRWYEIRRENGGDWALYQEGTYAPADDAYRWMGSAAMNANGDIAIGYSVSNSTDIKPSIRYTGRHADDPLGVMTVEEVELKTGTSSQSSFSRWGDYACLNVDPDNDTVFWFTTEYNGWSTWISSFDLGGLAGATASAGDDAYICTNDQFQTSGSGTGVLEILWTTSGDGFFSPANQFNSTYIRGSQDVANHGCTLTMTVTGFDGNQVSDDLVLSIVPWVNAGEDVTILNTDAYQLLAEGTDYGTILWTTNGDGTFSDDAIMQPIYTPGTQDLNNGQVTLTVQVSITDPCTATKTDAMILSFTGVGINEINTSNLNIYPNPTNDIFTLSVDGLTTGEQFTFFVYTSYGKEVYRQIVDAKSSNYKKVIDMSDFKAGIYFLTIKTQSGTTTTKVIKE